VNGQQAGGAQLSSHASPARDGGLGYHSEGEESRGEQGEERGGKGKRAAESV